MNSKDAHFGRGHAIRSSNHLVLNRINRINGGTVAWTGDDCHHEGYSGWSESLAETHPRAGNWPRLATAMTLALSLLCSVAVGRAEARSPGTVVGWGNHQHPYVEPDAVFTKIAAGASHSLALRSDGVVVGWGENQNRQHEVPSSLTNVTGIAAGWYHSLAVRADGSVVAWGNNNSGQTNVPANLTNIVAVAGGSQHNLALRADGTVVAWGNNSYGQTNMPGGLNNVIAIAAGSQHSLALRADGAVVAWGLNNHGQSSVPGVSITFDHATGGIIIGFPTLMGSHYTIEYRTTLAGVDWTPLPEGTVAGTGTPMTVTDTSAAGAPRRFYRLKRWTGAP
jgi:hypothetical protein